jgi:[phosphatase 2A protein]-leucine-carboxy methyltransferase
MGEDEVTQMTAKDCLRNKYLTSMRGYVGSSPSIDPFLPLMTNFIIKNHDMVSNVPIIRRGYYARMSSQRMVMDQFLNATSSRADVTRTQILCLGSGYDTEYWSQTLSSNGRIALFEVDFPKTIDKKVEFCNYLQVSKNDKPKHPTGGVKFDRSRINELLENTTFGDKGCPIQFISRDLRDDVDLVVSDLMEAGFCIDSHHPTLIITEVVMVYMDAKSGNGIIKKLADLFSASSCSATWVSYDMLYKDDPFGQMMLGNLTRRNGLSVPSLLDYPTLDSQEKRFVDLGWESVKVYTMLAYYDRFVSVEEKKRIAAIEMLDEVEEWKLLMGHYSLTVASIGTPLFTEPPSSTSTSSSPCSFSFPCISP